MPFKQEIKTLDLEQQRLSFKQDVESKVVERTTFDFTPVTTKEIFETATANLVRNIPELTGLTVATTASASVLGAGPVTLFVMSKAVPTVAGSLEFINEFMKAKTSEEWEYNLGKSTVKETVENMGDSEFSKGMVESMTLGYVIPKGEETGMRTLGNVSGSIIRDYLVTAGMPIPWGGAIAKKVGKNAVDTGIMSVAMMANNGIEEYNRAVNTGKTQDEAYKLMNASVVGNGAGSAVAFYLIPWMGKSLFKKTFGGMTLLGKLTGGVNLAGYDTAAKLAGGLVVDEYEKENGELTNKYELTYGDAAAIFGVGLGFTAAGWGAGKIAKGIGYAAKYPFGLWNEHKMKKEAYKAEADNIKEAYGTSKIDNEDMDMLERDLTKDMVDSIVDEIKAGLQMGFSKQFLIKEAFKNKPAEYTNPKNIESIEEIFSNVF